MGQRVNGHFVKKIWKGKNNALLINFSYTEKNLRDLTCVVGFYESTNLKRVSVHPTDVVKKKTIRAGGEIRTRYYHTRVGYVSTRVK